MQPFIESNANNILFGGSVILALIYQLMAYLGIETAQVITLLIVFCFSGVVGIIRTLTLKEHLKGYLASDLLSKALMMFIPFIFALVAKNISVLYVLVDYSFSFLILGELLAILVGIQSIKQKKPIQELDVYNLFVDKFKLIVLKFLKMDKLSYDRQSKLIKDEVEVAKEIKQELNADTKKDEKAGV